MTHISQLVFMPKYYLFNYLTLLLPVESCTFKYVIKIALIEIFVKRTGLITSRDFI